jgi:hypothetical protein
MYHLSLEISLPLFYHGTQFSIMPFLPTLLEMLERHEHLHISDESQRQLLSMSAATSGSPAVLSAQSGSMWALHYKSGNAAQTLKQHRLRQLETRLKATAFWEEHDYVFCTLVGTHLRPSHVVDEFKKLLKKANLPDIRFHDLRHSAATLLLSLGIHPKVVQEMFGHTQISMTMDIYSHILPSMQQDAVSKLNTLLMRREGCGVAKDE